MTVTLDTRQLRAFAAVAETCSFTLAAKQLHLTPSAISHAINSLEEAIGCRVLDRMGKTVILNQAGEQLLFRARNIFNEMGLAQNEIEQLSQWGRGRLRLSATPTACQYIVPAVLREFKESFPRCTLLIEPGDSAKSLELLRHNRVDLTLSLEPKRDPNLIFRPLFQDELLFMVSPLHPWAQNGRVDPKELVRQNFIFYSRTSVTYKLIEDYLAGQSLSLPSLIEFGSMEAIKEMVKLGLGVSILSPWITRKELEEKSLVALPLGRKKLRRQWGILWRKGRRLSLSEETFIGLCQNVTANLG